MEAVIKNHLFNAPLSKIDQKRKNKIQSTLLNEQMFIHL